MRKIIVQSYPGLVGFKRYAYFCFFVQWISTGKFRYPAIIVAVVRNGAIQVKRRAKKELFRWEMLFAKDEQVAIQQDATK